MDRCDRLTAFLAVLPVLGTLAGFWISHRLESGRQEDQRTHEREARQRQDRRNLLEQLPVALAGVRDGSHTTALLLAADRRRGVEAGRIALAEPWWRDWQAAQQRVDALTAQLADEELSAAVKAVEAVGMRADLMQALQGEDARAALKEALPELDAAYAEANEIVGRVIHEIDTFEPPHKNPWWQR